MIHAELEEALQVQFACTGKVPLPPLTPILAEGCGRVMAQTAPAWLMVKVRGLPEPVTLILAWRTLGLGLAAALQLKVSFP